MARRCVLEAPSAATLEVAVAPDTLERKRPMTHSTGLRAFLAALAVGGAVALTATPAPAQDYDGGGYEGGGGYEQGYRRHKPRYRDCYYRYRRVYDEYRGTYVRRRVRVCD
jgi:hypothetical protein